MLTVWIVLGAVLLLLGLVGCVIPVIPGPVLAYCGVLALVPTEKCPSMVELVALGALVVVVSVADYVVPAIGARKFDCSRWGAAGCFVGTLVGIFFLPFGIVVGPFLGAFSGELIAGKSIRAAVRGGFGALLGFLSGVFLKLLVCLLFVGVFLWRILN